jgi:hypothetical protein
VIIGVGRMNERNKQSPSRSLLPPPFHDYLDLSIIGATEHSPLIKRSAIYPHFTLTHSCMLRHLVDCRLEGFVSMPPRPPSESLSTTPDASDALNWSLCCRSLPWMPGLYIVRWGWHLSPLLFSNVARFHLLSTQKPFDFLTSSP